MVKVCELYLLLASAKRRSIFVEKGAATVRSWRLQNIVNAIEQMFAATQWAILRTHEEEEVSIMHFTFACRNKTFECFVISVCLPDLWRSDCRLLVHKTPLNFMFFIFNPRRKGRVYLLLLNTCPHLSKDARFRKFGVKVQFSCLWITLSLSSHGTGHFSTGKSKISSLEKE